jgi:hypothetical protein
MEDSFSPLLHRLEQAIRWRAVHPNELLPPPSEKLTQFSKPSEEVQARAKKYLDRIIKAADVKKGNNKLCTAVLTSILLTVFAISSTQGQRPQT